MERPSSSSQNLKTQKFMASYVKDTDPKVKEKTKESLLDDSPPIVQLNNYEVGTARSQRPNRYDPYSFLENMSIPIDFTNIGKNKPQGAQNVIPGTINDDTNVKKPMPHCKACTDFKTWMELTAHPRRNMSREEREQKECPLDSELLGRNTWAFLHTMAAYYPEKPSLEQQHNMKQFIKLLSQFYPCHTCASHLREDLKNNTPDTSSNIKLSEWFCNLHNGVNVRLGKVEFDCSKVLERWRDGWKDGKCD
ncbi:FAD-linked sulfhydryl oxidase ALR [Biomphalaria glabrata]|uniref:Sulfhydryl oxidase n=1 Tax=Biomphalaria glabrata TaxID=6526 RepID=A0A9U8EHA7_BIOGL|nr:FAD-linked sulfhydryl oxidase ALR-like [Biomphalaria glabrata]XP_013087340.2 FAD-linked sulfhydryl oxidase ALR-like [Biomphalaria glabrata]XP_013087417.2 FAD-linked sulfhydryl oxidase ALR-like [Biomphalaria glabrata]XP_013087492.2 FAD-linked sulfhydryl oxidase ALR-like [Biomphalaria glabrata]XP_013087570.2 FAD-linked sulfhydryl oxidase ALR-like [Biomphalaria glabrata]KAI8796838.1 FAD-linked sulfhydryl oxidase ALR [Biomphalaria glabrata]